MKLYLLSQDEHNGYDVYDSIVVCAKNANAARQMHPSARKDNSWPNSDSWASIPENVHVEYLGIAGSEIEEGIVLASYNAG